MNNKENQVTVINAYLKPTNPYHYHYDESATILKVVIVQPSENNKKVVCYLVEFDDGSKEYFPLALLAEAQSYVLTDE